MARTEGDIAGAAAELIDAFNEADWSRLRPLLASDLVYDETGTGRRVEGADAYVALLDGWKAAFPDVAGTIRDAITSDNVVAQEIHWHGTQTGPLETPTGTVEASGKPVSVDASIWYRFQGEAISEIHHYLDVATLLEQIGAR
jgi:steroid delta-isomerase-like uncharacterized protein